MIDKETPCMSFGRFKGQAIDIRTRRSAQVHRKENDKIYLKYFFHAGAFYNAQIPISGVRSIQGQRFSFGLPSGDVKEKTGVFSRLKKNLVNHAQVRFVFEETQPVLLFDSNDPDCLGESSHSLRDIIYSVEVVGPLGEKWSVKNAFGDLACAHRFISTEEMFFERVVLAEYTIDQTPVIPFSKKEQESALMTCLNRAHSSGLDSPYYLLTPFFGASNCTSEAFGVLDETLWDRYTLRQKFIAKSLWRLPLSLERYLKLRGIRFQGDRSVLLNDELAGLLLRPDLVKRAETIKNRKS